MKQDPLVFKATVELVFTADFEDGAAEDAVSAMLTEILQQMPGPDALFDWQYAGGNSDESLVCLGQIDLSQYDKGEIFADHSQMLTLAGGTIESANPMALAADFMGLRLERQDDGRVMAETSPGTLVHVSELGYDQDWDKLMQLLSHISTLPQEDGQGPWDLFIEMYKGLFTLRVDFPTGPSLYCEPDPEVADPVLANFFAATGFLRWYYRNGRS